MLCRLNAIAHSLQTHFCYWFKSKETNIQIDVRKARARCAFSIAPIHIPLSHRNSVERIYAQSDLTFIYYIVFFFIRLHTHSYYWHFVSSFSSEQRKKKIDHENSLRLPCSIWKASAEICMSERNKLNNRRQIKILARRTWRKCEIIRNTWASHELRDVCLCTSIIIIV